jgi:phosphatidylglycerol lysyltransferase
VRVRHIIRPTDWVKNFLGISIGLALIVVLMKTLQSLDTNQLWATFADVAPIQWATAIGFTAISFAALGRYDVIIHKVLNTGISSRLAFRSGMIGIALAQVLGFGLITGSLVRWRVLGGLSLTRCGAVTVFASMSFLIALAALIGVTLFFVPLPLPAWVPVAAGVSFILIVALVAFAPLRLVPRLARHWPGLLAARGIFIWTAIDTLAAASAFYVLLPAEHGVPLITIFAIYLVALGAGLVSNAPGGLGAFELTALALLPSLAPETVVASILAFRLVYYALPAVVAICFLVPKPKETVPNATVGIDFYPDSVTLNTAQSRQAEAGLIRQQHAGFLVAGRGHRTAHWLVAPLAHYGVAIGRPLGTMQTDHNLSKPCQNLHVTR